VNVSAPLAALTPTSGEMRGHVHVLPLRVYYEDTDAGGIVYYANYLKFAERGRTEFLRTLGIAQQRLRDETGLQFVMHEGEVKYKKPARLDDILSVETTLADLGAASVTMRQTIRRGAEELVCFTAHVACTDTHGKPMRMPAQLKAVLETCLEK
jgi:acyl-CoA thioester hydrolase